MPVYTVSIHAPFRIAGTTVTNANYNIDWSILPENTSFKVTFSFISDTTNITSLTSIPLLGVFLGGTDAYRINPSTQSTYTVVSNLMGILAPPVLSATTYLRAETTSNTPIYLKTRPIHNVLTVGVFTQQGAFWVDNVGATLTNYSLVLSFETVDE